MSTRSSLRMSCKACERLHLALAAAPHLNNSFLEIVLGNEWIGIRRNCQRDNCYVVRLKFRIVLRHMCGGGGDGGGGVCVYVYACLCVYVCLCVHGWMRARAYVCVCVCVCICMCVWV